MGDVDGARPEPGDDREVALRLQPARPAPQQGPHPAQQHGRGRQARPPPPASTASITYVNQHGSAERVRAKHVVMACWNRVTARLVDGLPRHQVEALDYARKVPLVYCRVGLRNWQAFADAQISSVSPRGNSLFWDSTSLSAGARFGSSYGPTPNTPGAAGHAELDHGPERPEGEDPARVLRARARAAAQHELPRLRAGDHRRHRPQREPGGRRLRARARHRVDHGQPLELRLRVRADLDVRPVAIRAEREAAARASAASPSATWRSRTATPAPSPTRTARSTRPTGRCRNCLRLVLHHPRADDEVVQRAVLLVPQRPQDVEQATRART